MFLLIVVDFIRSSRNSRSSRRLGGLQFSLGEYVPIGLVRTVQLLDMVWLLPDMLTANNSIHLAIDFAARGS